MSKPVISVSKSEAPIRIACFVTSHGLGHAARACAVLETLHSLNQSIHFELFTQAPDWFFNDSLPPGCFNYHAYPSDVGLVQSTPFTEDLPATLQRLSEFYPPAPAEVNRLANEINALGCRLILCDIAPLGIVVARAAGLPSVLVENFTWDWIYTGYSDQDNRFDRYIGLLGDMFTSSSVYIQTAPVCNPVPSADLVTGPVSRKPRCSPHEIHARLQIPDGARLVLVSMGGFPFNYPDLKSFARMAGVIFIIPGGSNRFEHSGNLILLPHHTPIYHPDLVAASDVVIGKSGYSTVAEAYHAGVPLGFISRARFREAGPVGEFIRREMDGIEISESAFTDGTWTKALLTLLDQPRRQPVSPNGALAIADYLNGLLAR